MDNRCYGLESQMERCMPRHCWPMFCWGPPLCWPMSWICPSFPGAPAPQRQPRREAEACGAWRCCPGEEKPGDSCPESSSPGEDCIWEKQSCDPAVGTGEQEIRAEFSLPPGCRIRQVRTELAALRWLSPDRFALDLHFFLEYHDRCCRIRREEERRSPCFSWRQRCLPQASLLGRPSYRQEGTRLFLKQRILLSC
ncbi:MAG: hypothetical protein Q4B50_00170 [Bacillota bacterium]|nr:hypothetical protein [Bacillota bacterium]